MIDKNRVSCKKRNGQSLESVRSSQFEPHPSLPEGSLTLRMLIWNTAFALSVIGIGRPRVNSKKSPSKRVAVPDSNSASLLMSLDAECANPRPWRSGPAELFRLCPPDGSDAREAASVSSSFVLCICAAKRPRSDPFRSKILLIFRPKKMFCMTATCSMLRFPLTLSWIPIW